MKQWNSSAASALSFMVSGLPHRRAPDTYRCIAFAEMRRSVSDIELPQVGPQWEEPSARDGTAPARSDGNLRWTANSGRRSDDCSGFGSYIGRRATVSAHSGHRAAAVFLAECRRTHRQFDIPDGPQTVRRGKSRRLGRRKAVFSPAHSVRHNRCAGECERIS